MKTKQLLCGSLFLAGSLSACSSGEKSEKQEEEVVIKTTEAEENVIFEYDFSSDLEPELWRVEMEDQPNSSVTVSDGKLVLDTKGGVTVWLDKKLEGNIEITYERQVVMGDGVNDRLSDLNNFWMATDPDDENLFTRSGAFKEYDGLSMYYVGFGGNYNSTTRFRKYHGDGEKPLLFDLGDEGHLLQPNHWYEIKIQVKDGTTKYWVDGKIFFEYTDEDPLTEGYFGFRSTYSRHEIDNLKIVRLD